MLHYIKGQITMKFVGGVVLEAGGLGYEVHLADYSSIYLIKEGEIALVYTAMIVREDDINIYGFGERDSLSLFRKLIGISGVGAKAAMSVLSAMPLAELKQAIVFEDAVSLTRANGIGKKTAQRIVLELKDKLDTVGSLPVGVSSAEGILSTDEKATAVNALTSLGYSKGEAVNALATILDNDLTAEEYIKLALKKLF